MNAFDSWTLAALVFRQQNGYSLFSKQLGFVESI